MFRSYLEKVKKGEASGLGGVARSILPNRRLHPTALSGRFARVAGLPRGLQARASCLGRAAGEPRAVRLLRGSGKSCSRGSIWGKSWRMRRRA